MSARRRGLSRRGILAYLDKKKMELLIQNLSAYGESKIDTSASAAISPGCFFIKLFHWETTASGLFQKYLAL